MGESLIFTWQTVLFSAKSNIWSHFVLGDLIELYIILIKRLHVGA